MRGGRILFHWTVTLVLCITALLGAHALRWPAAQDPFVHLRRSVAELEPQLSPGSPVALRVNGLGEDYFNYLRYSLIPRPLELRFRNAVQVVLLCAPASESAAVDRLHYERPELTCMHRMTGPGYCLSIFKPAS